MVVKSPEFASWEAITKYNVLSPMGVFVLGGIYIIICICLLLLKTTN